MAKPEERRLEARVQLRLSGEMLDWVAVSGALRRMLPQVAGKGPASSARLSVVRLKGHEDVFEVVLQADAWKAGQNPRSSVLADREARRAAAERERAAQEKQRADLEAEEARAAASTPGAVWRREIAEDQAAGRTADERARAEARARIEARRGTGVHQSEVDKP